MIGRVDLWRLNPVRTREPVTKRAWAFQEYLLSNRTLFYDSYKLRWICSCSTRHWDAKDDDSHNINPNIVQKNWFQNLPSEPAPDEYEDGYPGMINRPTNWGNSSDCIKDWYRHVARFSLRDITQFVDKLPAMMGVMIIHYVFLEKPDFQSGIWFPSNWRRDTNHPLPVGVAAGLLWFTESTRTRKLYYPSWSWTSSDGHLDMSYCLRFLESPPDVEVTPVSPHRSRVSRVYRNFSTIPMIFDYHGVPIRLKGRTRNAVLSEGNNNQNMKVTIPVGDGLIIKSTKQMLDVDLWTGLSGQDTEMGRSWQQDPKGTTSREVLRKPSQLLTQADIPNDASSGIPVTLLRFYAEPPRAHSPSASMVGLILLKFPGTENYIRIGVFDFHDNECEGDDPESQQGVWHKIEESFRFEDAWREVKLI